MENFALNDNHLVIGTPPESPLLYKFFDGGGFVGAPPSPSPSMRWSAVYGGPVKVENEEVFVMDEVLVNSGRRALRGSNSSRSLSSMSIGSSGGSVNSFENACKIELCRAWEELGSCRLGSSCQFAHGKEELRPTRLSAKKRPEALMCKSFKSTGSSTNLQSCHFFRSPVPLAFTEAASPVISQIASPAKLELTCKTPVPVVTKYEDWSPLDDGIEIALPSSSDTALSREDVDAYIHDAIYGSTPRKRLPVFIEICPE